MTSAPESPKADAREKSKCGNWGRGGNIADIIYGHPSKDHHRFSFLFVWHSHLAPSFFSAFSEGGGDDKEIGRLTHSLSYSSLVLLPCPAAAIHPFYADVRIKKIFMLTIFWKFLRVTKSCQQGSYMYYICRTFSKPLLQADVSLMYIVLACIKTNGKSMQACPPQSVSSSLRGKYRVFEANKE